VSAAFEIHREGEINYAKPLARALLRDGRLSFGARGLFSFLWDLPGGWRTNSEHLASMSPQGRDAVRTLLKELEKVGAMRSEPVRNENGKMAGKRWILVSPERWAIESSLSPSKNPPAAPNGASTERRVSRPSENPTVGESNSKVLQGEGSPNKSTTTTTQAVEEIDDLVDAAVWVYKKDGGVIQKEAAFKHKVRARILSHGIAPEDAQSLLAWRAHAQTLAQEKEKKQVYDSKLNSSVTRASVAAGLENIRAALRQ
jgi:hypothetical protein